MTIDRSSYLPVVSVAITSYNSKHCIGRALDSVLAQVTSFPVEIVIGDDCSSDGTIDVARDYQQRYPSQLTVLERSQNVGIQRNYYETFLACKGKYIAWLDADDRWTAPDKLAVQIDLMEQDPSIQLCGHYIRVVSADGEVKQERSPSLPPGYYGLKEMLHNCFVPSISGVFRSELTQQLPRWYFNLAPVTEWPIWVLAALAGKVVMIDRVMADYTHSPGSAAWSKGPLFANTMEALFLENAESILPEEWRRVARAERGEHYEAIAYYLRQQRQFHAARQFAWKAFTTPVLTDRLFSKSKALLAAYIKEAGWHLRGRPLHN